jgi:hypothetical protein
MVQLSPFTQYFVRKLLRHYLEQWQRTPVVNSIRDVGGIDVARVFRGLYGEQVAARVYELEALIALYGELEQQGRDSMALEQMERQILQLLGLRLGGMLPTMLPRTVQESQIRRFRFWRGGGVREAMYCDQVFYGLVKTQGGGRLEMQRMAWALAQQEVVCMLSQGEGAVCLWVSLRSSAAGTLMTEGPVVMDRLMQFHPKLCRLRERQGRFNKQHYEHRKLMVA